MDAGTTTTHILPKPLEALNYEQGRFLSFDQAELGKGWSISQPDWKKIGGSTRAQFKDIPMLWAEDVGATLTLPFEGTAIGMFIVSGPDAGIVEYSIDDAPFKRIDLFTKYSRGLHFPWTCMFASDLAPGEHTLLLRVSDQKNARSKGHAVRIKASLSCG